MVPLSLGSARGVMTGVASKDYPLIKHTLVYYYIENDPLTKSELLGCFRFSFRIRVSTGGGGQERLQLWAQC